MNSVAAKLSRDDVEAIYPLRPVQAGMLFHELQAEGRSPYFRQVSFALAGTVDPALCEATWNRLMARHALLRSVFDFEKTTKPVQIVLKRLDVDFGFEDVRGPQAEGRVRAWRDADARRGFRLRHDRLMRVRLFRLAEDRFEMVWSHPHILLDGWSGAILTEEFREIYAAARQGRDADLPEPPDPGEYLAALAHRDNAESRAYWDGLLEGYDELATLPRDRARLPDGAMPEPAIHAFRLGEPEAKRISALARSHGVTPGTVFQALWGLLLGGWTGRQDVVFGTVVSGRSVASIGIERLVGLFINTLPVRVRFERGQTFADLLRNVQRQAVAAIPHDHAALTEIQARSALPSGLIDHLVVIENYPEAADSGADVGFNVTGIDACEQSNYDFGLIVELGATGINVQVPYDSNAFSPDRIARICTHLRNLIAQVLDDPGRRLQDLDIMDTEERARLDAFAEGPSTPWPEDTTLADLWHRQVERTPGNVAVVAGGERITYAELDRRAEDVALRLRIESLEEDEVIGVLAGRGAGRIVALLGILKAGGAYLPLSPEFPDERLRFMIDDTGCRKVLVDDECATRLRAIRPGLERPIAIAPADGARSRPDVKGPDRAGPGSLAYVIYTSGSTGKPKGVALAHSGFVNMITAQIAGFGVGPDDAVLQFASCSFDASLSEIFMALLAGARLVVAPEDVIRDGEPLLALMAAEKVTVATLPPSYLTALEKPDLAGLRVLITAGEAADVNDAMHYAGRLRYFNAYGPTEASVCASWHEMRPGASYSGGIPIGRPIANTRMAVLDPWGRPVPIGAVGEICLAGAGLARRYLGLPEATAERFVTIGGRRHYRTGDHGRWLEDGNLLYLGRQDGQAKINGHRIETGEIENRLKAHADVAQAAVIVSGETRQLTAYVTVRRPVEAETLRRHLAAVLPDWMVPAAIMILPSLPLTAAGKVDRHALPKTGKDAVEEESLKTAAEAAVAEAFARILGGGPFGRRASFAALGGGSLQAIQLLGQLRRKGMALDLQGLLRADTVAAIAAAAEAAETIGVEDAAPPHGPVGMTPTQLWFLRAHSRGHAHLNHQFLLETKTRLEIAAVAAAVAALWQAHEALRLRFSRQGGQWTADLAPAKAAPRPRDVDLRHERDPWSALLADAESLQSAFILEEGPLFRTVRYRLPEGDGLLLLAHHLVVDAVSWRIILEDLQQALARTGPERIVRLPGPALPFSAWTARLNEWSRSEGIEAERPYWQEIAEAAVQPLPTDRPPVRHGYAETAFVTADLGTRAASWPDTRIVAGLLDALGSALNAWDGHVLGRVLVSTHGRQSPFSGIDPSRTVGWLASEFPFLIACPGGGAGALAGIESRLALVPGGGLGWGVLRWLAPRPVEAPEEEICLNFLGTLDPVLADGFRVSERPPSVSVGALERRRLIEIESHVAGGRLGITLRYAPAIHDSATIEALAERVDRAFANITSEESDR